MELLVFPELCLSGYTCNDLFLQEVLLEQVKEELKNLVDFTRGRKMLLFAGLPWEHEGKLYNVAAALNHGKILGLTTKTFLPNYGEFYEMRQFTPGPEKARYISLMEKRSRSDHRFFPGSRNGRSDRCSGDL